MRLSADEDRRAIQHRLNETVLDSLKSLALVLTGYYVLMAVSHALLLAPPIAGVMALVAAASALFSLGL